jgi:hypothetical protein
LKRKKKKKKPSESFLELLCDVLFSVGPPGYWLDIERRKLVKGIQLQRAS